MNNQKLSQFLYDANQAGYGSGEQIFQGEKLIYKASYMGGLVDQQASV